MIDAPPSAGQTTISDRIRSINPLRLSYVVRSLSILAAGLLGFAGIMGLFHSERTVDVTYYLFAVYTTVFSIFLLAFEMRLKSFDKFVANNFGFMFNFIGRSVFMSFLGSMVVNLNPASICYPVAIVTFVILSLNAFILCASQSTSVYLVPANRPVIHKIPRVNATDVLVDVVANNPNAVKKAAAMAGNREAAVVVDVISANPEASKKAAKIASNSRDANLGYSSI